MNWYEEGREVALDYIDQARNSENSSVPEPECPWPMHTPEGREWFQGWNSVVKEEDPKQEMVCLRPERPNLAFMPHE